ncbi:hypothetical protein ACTA71_012581 [Dictyostelium dimigraforme]
MENIDECIQSFNKIKGIISNKSKKLELLALTPENKMYLKEIVTYLYNWSRDATNKYSISGVNEPIHWYWERFENIFQIYRVVIQEGNFPNFEDLEIEFKNILRNFLSPIEIKIVELTKMLIINYYNMVIDDEIKQIRIKNPNFFFIGKIRIPTSSGNYDVWKDKLINQFSVLSYSDNDTLNNFIMLIGMITCNMNNISILDVEEFKIN